MQKINRRAFAARQLERGEAGIRVLQRIVERGKGTARDEALRVLRMRLRAGKSTAKTIVIGRRTRARNARRGWEVRRREAKRDEEQKE